MTTAITTQASAIVPLSRRWRRIQAILNGRHPWLDPAGVTIHATTPDPWVIAIYGGECPYCVAAECNGAITLMPPQRGLTIGDIDAWIATEVWGIGAKVPARP